jgi:hypothetical protein
VVWELASAGVRTSRFLVASPGFEVNAHELDSFSQASVATAALEQEGQELLQNYLDERRQKRDCALDGNAIYASNHSNAAMIPQRTNDHSLTGLATIRQIEQLHGIVHKLSSELDRKFMMVYYENGLWNEFLEHYLSCLHAEPQGDVVEMWEWCALEGSRNCHRTDEIVDGLERLTRLHPEYRTAQKLKKTLEEWKTLHPGVEVKGYSSTEP